MKLMKTIGLAAILAIGTACSNTAKGVEKDADKAGDKVEAATDRAANATAATTESASNSVGAAMQTGDVKTALLADSRLSAANINVESNGDTKTITLNGHVPTEAQKKIAEEIAKMKANEWKVVNNLSIRPN